MNSNPWLVKKNKKLSKLYNIESPLFVKFHLYGQSIININFDKIKDLNENLIIIFSIDNHKLYKLYKQYLKMVKIMKNYYKSYKIYKPSEFSKKPNAKNISIKIYN